jgi:hypothetical protein
MCFEKYEMKRLWGDEAFSKQATLRSTHVMKHGGVNKAEEGSQTQLVKRLRMV